MYKFRIEEKVLERVQSGSFEWVWEAIKVSPIYDDSAKLTATREQNEMFCRYDFDADFTFTGDDYDKFVTNGEYRISFSSENMNKDFGGLYRGGRFKGQRVLKKDGEDDKVFAMNERGFFELRSIVYGNLQRVAPDGEYYFDPYDTSDRITTLYYLEDGEGQQPVNSGYAYAIRRLNEYPEYRMRVFHIGSEGTETEVISAYFNLTDMDLDEDNKIAKLKLKGKDKYEEFLNKYDAEYDLVQLAPPRSSVKLHKRPFLQLYVLGDTKLTHVQGNFEYEVDASGNATDITKESVIGMGFSLLKEYIIVRVKTEPSWGLSKYDGEYVGEKSSGILWRTDGEMRMVKATQPIGEVTGGWDIWPKEGFSPDYTWLRVSLADTLEFSGDILYVDKSGSGEHIYGGSVSGSNRDIYGRIVTDSRLKATGEIAFDNDVWQKNLNYRYYVNILDSRPLWTDIANRVKITLETTSVPNKWSQDDNGMYFVPPTPLEKRNRIVAIGWNQWIPMAIWFENSTKVSEEMAEYDVEWTLKDAYSISDAINILLSKVSGGIELVSEFLDNTQKAGAEYFELYMTPITNIKRTYYNHASQRGKITLKQILDMLKICFNCYWFLQWRNNGWVLRIEHISWFRNGGDYLNKYIYKDLSLDRVNLSDKPWITDQHKFRFDMGEIRSRVSFEWGDKSSEIFNGKPLISSDNIAKGKNVESLQVANFVADIDIIESSPESLSDDIYVIIGTDWNQAVRMDVIGYYGDGTSVLPNYPQFIPQNSLLTFYYTEQRLLNYDLSATDKGRVLMEDYDESGNLPVNSHSFKPIVRESIRVPYAIDKPDLCEELFKTDSGVSLGMGGNFRSISTNIFTQVSEIEMEFTYGL